MMAAVRSRNSKAEILLRSALWRAGYRFRLHALDLVGKPDIIFPSRQVAVFVDGDFWHGRGILQDGEPAFRQTMRGARTEWWMVKLNRTIERDRQVTEALSVLGWRVIRVWESVVLNDPAGAARRVAKVLDKGATR
jgi:DNA mismatch endonuclease, patch repair protein